MGKWPSHPMKKEISEDVVKRLAAIFGDNSAAAKALQDAEKRRAAGEVVKFYDGRHRGQSYLVVEGTPV